jgi:hypothetical protein
MGGEVGKPVFFTFFKSVSFATNLVAIQMKKFRAELQIIGINPFVFVPENILQNIFKQAKKDKGPIPICGTVNAKPYKQTLVKYSGEWRLYINTTMLANSPKLVGKIIEVAVKFDREIRTVEPPVKFVKALKANKEAKKVFDNLIPSMRLEIVRYLANLKTEETLDRNIAKAINFLLGRERFVGRDKP